MTSPQTRLAARLARLLNLVPYFKENPGISAAEAAAELGVTTKQLMTDLNQLWVCGLPGYGPGDLIDLAFSEESIEVTFTAGIERPLRLRSIEATALLVALRSIVEMPGMVDPTAAHGAIAKIEHAAGSAAAAQKPESVDHAPPARAEDPAAATVRAAVDTGRAVRIVYYSASRDAVTERVVDPIRTLLVDNQTYLQAWCRAAEAVRLFRFDRIESAEMLDEPARPPAAALADTATLELFAEDSTMPLATLRIAKEYAWVTDHYPMGDPVIGADGSVVTTMRYATLDWMARLVLGFGSGVVVLDPPELIAAVADRAAAALSAYAELGVA